MWRFPVIIFACNKVVVFDWFCGFYIEFQWHIVRTNFAIIGKLTQNLNLQHTDNIVTLWNYFNFEEIKAKKHILSWKWLISCRGRLLFRNFILDWNFHSFYLEYQTTMLSSLVADVLIFAVPKHCRIDAT